MALIWFISFILFLFIELITVNLVTIWFAIGSLAALITTIFTNSYIVQVTVFVLVSIVTLLTTKPFIKKFKLFKITPTNSDMVIGKKGVVTKRIENNKYGEIKIYGNTWTATSTEEIDVGTKVKVLSIEGVKLIVEKEEK